MTAPSQRGSRHRAVQHLALLMLALAAIAATFAATPAGERTAAGRAEPAAAGVPPPPLAASHSHPPLWYDEATFARAVRDAPAPPPLAGEIAGGIIPHHWLAGHLITGFFAALAAQEQPPQTVILIGPNHYNAGRARALTSDLPWATPFGLVEPDSQRVDTLVQAGLVEIGGDVLTPEHSVAGIMPAIARYLPDARVVPIILAGGFSLGEAERLAGALAPMLDGQTVLVASVDFSHYLVQSEAQARDILTLRAIRALDSGLLFTLGNDYLDSPPSIAVLLESMRALGNDEFVLVANTNSGALASDELLPTTSYFTGYYYRTPAATR